MFRAGLSCQVPPSQNVKVHHVLIEGLELYAYHGVSEAERQVGHRYLIDVDLDVEGDAPSTDELTGTVDYGAVAQLVTEIATGKQTRTVERLGQIIGERLLADFPSAVSAEVTVLKPNPPAPVIAASAGAIVRVER